MLGMIIAMLYLYYMDRSNIMNSLLTGIIYADKWNCLIFRGLCRVYPVNLNLWLPIWHLLRSMRGGSVPEFPESPFSRLDAESETGQFWISSPIPSPVLTWFEHRDRFWVLSREPRLFQPETPILHIKPVEISPNSKSETRDNLTLSPSPSLRLGDPGTSRPSPSPRRVWRQGTRTFESETRDSGNSGPI